MKQLGKDILTAIFMGMILPGILLNVAVLWLEREEEPQAVPQSTAPEIIPHPMLMRSPEGTLTEMDMDTYLTGVVLAEMPASFEAEALKAQAVAARTYTQKASVTGGKHGDGSVCIQSSCCQAYITETDYLARGGTQDDLEKVRSAVTETSGIVLTYEGELIEAVYFSTSGGSTEDAAAVWGTDFPYLQSVSSPGEEGAAHYTDTVTFTPEEVAALLGAELSGDPKTWFTITTYTEGGGVASMTIGGQVYKGTQLRSKLGLRSTAFSVEVSDSRITVTTRGYGHRVGMSQYGADAMAATGSTYEEILAHYYPGTVLTLVEKTTL